MGQDLSCRRCGRRLNVGDLRSWDERKVQSFLAGEGCPLCLKGPETPPDARAQDGCQESPADTEVPPAIEQIRRLAEPRRYQENLCGLGAVAAGVAALVLPTGPQVNLVVAVTGVVLGILGRRRTRRHVLATAGLLLSSVVIWVVVLRFALGH